MSYPTVEEYSARYRALGMERRPFAVDNPSTPRQTDEVTPTTDIVGTNEIADRLGVGAQTVRTWAQRPYLNFPEPDYRVSGVPAWEWETIRVWAEETGRLTKGDA